ncbi:cell wall metabolism sensor histidine kinase WalK [uncultured Anaerococcus sp.]|uniref:sensor histidine kinase n=1 Tax=uncultured Anaerococcus sp. TaxID=293428 RepID=UPI00261D68B4|nr:ATP-binding protein [uncultured Anaerococcus sp.]
MKNLVSLHMKRMAYILLAITFLIANSFSYMIKKQAQSDLAKNTLGLLLYHEDNEESINLLEKIENENPAFSLIFLDDTGKVLYNPKSINSSSLKDIVYDSNDFFILSSYKNLLKVEKTYLIKADNTIAIRAYISLINWWLLSLFLLLTLISKAIIERITRTEVNKYISYLKDNSLDSVKRNLAYDELIPIFDKYEKEITYYRQRANLLKSRLSDIRSITSNMKEGFILFDSKGNARLMNESAKNYLDSPGSTNIIDIIDAREYSLALRESFMLKRSKRLDLKLNGYDLRIIIEPLADNRKKSCAMIIIDNTEEKKSEQMRREFSANVTHELKSPLTSINGYAELIATGIAKENDIKKFANIIYKEGNRLLEMIDDIIKISKIDEKEFEKDFIYVDIYEVVESIIENFQRITDSKKIDVSNNIKSYKIKTSKSLFYDLITNIYENAIKYNKVGGSISIDFNISKDNYYLVISDTGIGISKADSDRIFERFYVVDKSRKRNQKSTGLGLAIVKHIINYLGYSIRLESKLACGSKFIIEIPINVNDKAL